MSDYISCPKKRNSPRLHLRVCQEKCDSKSDCKSYLSVLRESLSGSEAGQVPADLAST